ncbi:20778_t:CDS:10, partial [Dentiscutata erythropus]
VTVETLPSNQQHYIHSNSHSASNGVTASSLYIPNSYSMKASKVPNSSLIKEKKILHKYEFANDRFDLRLNWIDFGIRKSGFAYANTGNPEVVTNDTWPEEAGVKKPKRNSTSKPVKLFKLHLYNIPEKEKPALPKGLDYKKVITDYSTELESVATRWPNVDFMNQILLIMAVPAEFSEQANATIRECVYKAGLISTQYSESLQLPTEREFHILYLRHPCTLKERMILDVGSTFLVLFCGADIVDLTTHELLENNRLGEVTKRSGDLCGGTSVDREFIKFLRRKVGDSAINKLLENHYGQFQYMEQEFCRRIKFPFTGNRNDFKTYELDIEELCPVLPQYVTGTSKVKFEENDWIIDLEYEDVKSQYTRTCAAMGLVGGFSESKYLQTRIKQEFGAQIREICIPSIPITAVARCEFIKYRST